MALQNQSVWITLLVTALCQVPLCGGYSILLVFPCAVKSHVALGDGIVRHLLNAGHKITYITPNIKDGVHENLTYVDVSSTKDAVSSRYNIQQFMKNKAKLDQTTTHAMTAKIYTLVNGDDNVRKLMENSNQHFDLVIALWLFTELYSGFAALFNCPFIWLFPYEPNFMATRLIDEATHPAYTANLELDIATPYSFVDRARNLWCQMTYQFNQYYYYDEIDRRVFEAVFQPLIVKKYGYRVEYDEVRFNASLLFSYTHSSLGHATRSPANMIAVGGYHIDENIAPLPDDLKLIMDNSKHGVIYFSMGSNMKSKDFPRQILNELIKIFGELQHTVIWKFEEALLDCPKNVHILKWAPQQSILGHPNCSLFITHGGLLSTTEAVHFGVPIIGCPVFLDQFSNIGRAVKKGFGMKVTLSLNYARDLKVAIDDILADPKYMNKAKELSFIYHHRPVPPGKELVQWVEHVVATRGAPHLRSPALHMPWYQKMYLDLAAVVVLVVIVVCGTIIYILKQESKLKPKLQIKKLV